MTPEQKAVLRDRLRALRPIPPNISVARWDQMHHARMGETGDHPPRDIMLVAPAVERLIEDHNELLAIIREMVGEPDES